MRFHSEGISNMIKELDTSVNKYMIKELDTSVNKYMIKELDIVECKQVYGNFFVFIKTHQLFYTS